MLADVSPSAKLVITLDPEQAVIVSYQGDPVAGCSSLDEVSGTGPISWYDHDFYNNYADIKREGDAPPY